MRVRGSWREVVRIESARTGPRGGGVWWLTLACGHLKSARQPRFDPARDLAPPVFSQQVFRVDGTRRRRVRKFTAPERVRCLVCKE